MKLKTILFFIGVFVSLQVQMAYCQNASPEPDLSAKGLSPDEIIEQVEKRYMGSGFSARFDQKATIKAMDITDTAFGKVFIKHPGMMRWEYEAPEKQLIITDSKTLWIYRPEDNQVMMGNAPAYFGNGKGVSFLSDIKLIREKFIVSLGKKDERCCYILKLLPKEKKFDIAVIYLAVSRQNFDLVRIVSYNSYEDETRIEMSNFQFNQPLNDSLFTFIIPSGADLLQIEE